MSKTEADPPLSSDQLQDLLSIAAGGVRGCLSKARSLTGGCNLLFMEALS